MMNRLDSIPADRLTLGGRVHPLHVLAAAMVVAFGLMLWWIGERTFAIDEWDYVTQRYDWSLNNIIRPTNGHLLAVPLIVYKALLSGFGADSHLPFTLLTIVLHLLVVGLFFALAARRIGAWLALIPTVLILFLGSGWEVMINTAAMQNKFGIAAGLGMMLCLDRRDRCGDVGAGVLLAVSCASFTIGLAFAVAAAIRILLERSDGAGTRRLALVALPLAAYAIWFLWARQYDQSVIEARSIASLASGIVDQLSSIIAALTGLFRSTSGDPGGGLVVERATFLTFVALGLLALRLRRPPRPGPSAWAALAVLAAYLLLVGIGLSDIRLPESSRYAYMGGVLFLVAAVELVAGSRISRGWALAAVAVLPLSLLANVGQMKASGDFLELESNYNRAELAALEATRDTVNPALIPEQIGVADFSALRDLYFPASDYFAMVDRVGSPAYSEEELATAPEGAREAADKSFVRNLGIVVTPLEPDTAPPPGTEPPRSIGELNSETTSRGACLRSTPLEEGQQFLNLALPGDGFTFSSSVPPLEVGLRRFATEGTAPLGPFGRTGAVTIPADAASREWTATFILAAPTTICAR